MKSKIHPNPYFSKFNLRVSFVGGGFTCKIKKNSRKKFWYADIHRRGAGVSKGGGGHLHVETGWHVSLIFSGCK